MQWARDLLRQRDRADRGGTPVERRCPRGIGSSRADELEPAAPGRPRMLPREAAPERLRECRWPARPSGARGPGRELGVPGTRHPVRLGVLRRRCPGLLMDGEAERFRGVLAGFGPAGGGDDAAASAGGCAEPGVDRGYGSRPACGARPHLRARGPKDAAQVLSGPPNDDDRLGARRGSVGFPSPAGRFPVERLADSSGDSPKIVNMTMLFGPPAKGRLRAVGYGAYEK
jgi:hypothetical protein